MVKLWNKVNEKQTKQLDHFVVLEAKFIYRQDKTFLTAFCSLILQAGHAEY